MNDQWQQLAVVLSVLATLAVNSLANILPFNGQTTGEVSNQIDSLFTPAGYVFSIWGLIYLGLSVFAVYQALPASRENPRLRASGWWVSLSGLANMVWLVLWHYERFVLTLVAMLVLLGSLMMTYVRLEIGRRSVSAPERWLAHLPFSIYLGWITVATVANASVVLVTRQWDGFGIPAQYWLYLVLVVILLLAIAMSFRRHDVAFNTVLLWALAGIAVRQAAFPAVAIAAWVAFAMVALALAVSLVMQSRRRRIEGAAENEK